MSEWLKQDDLCAASLSSSTTPASATIHAANSRSSRRRRSSRCCSRATGCCSTPRAIIDSTPFVDTAISIDPQTRGHVAAHLVAVVGRSAQGTRREGFGSRPRPCAKASIRFWRRPICEGDIEVVQPKVYYQFADRESRVAEAAAEAAVADGAAESRAYQKLSDAGQRASLTACRCSCVPNGREEHVSCVGIQGIRPARQRRRHGGRYRHRRRVRQDRVVVRRRRVDAAARNAAGRRRFHRSCGHAEGRATTATPAVSWNYGKFVQSIVDFAIIAFAIFMLIKAMNTMKKKEEAKPPEAARRRRRKCCLPRFAIC